MSSRRRDVGAPHDGRPRAPILGRIKDESPANAALISAMRALDHGEADAAQRVYAALLQATLLIAVGEPPADPTFKSDQSLALRTIDSPEGPLALAYSDRVRAHEAGVPGGLVSMKFADFCALLAPSAGVAINHGAPEPSGIVSRGWVIALASGAQRPPGPTTAYTETIRAGTALEFSTMETSADLRAALTAMLRRLHLLRGYVVGVTQDGTLRPTIVAVVPADMQPGERARLAHAIQLTANPFVTDGAVLDVLPLDPDQVGRILPRTIQPFFDVERRDS